MLELEEEFKNKLYSIRVENENNSSSDENLSDDDQLNIAYSSNNSKSWDPCKCGSAICTYKNHFINVITSSNKETFFDMIDHIEDPDFKKKYLIALRDLVLDKQSDNRTIKPFDMTSVLNKFKQPIKSNNFIKYSNRIITNKRWNKWY